MFANGNVFSMGIGIMGKEWQKMTKKLNLKNGKKADAISV